ncbi:paralemmin-2-like isoform X1 [Scophthalmus maximus]|nr:paralemmin-2-like isoform X1 [Scophthalmus maximus]XP_047183844.1 paralemmin-2-like isoform X1 [Scophthalmus maximus]
MTRGQRKYLRDQWLSEATSPSIFTRDSSWTSSLQHNKADEDTAAEKNKSQKTPQDKEEEAADARKEEQASLEENKESVHCAATARTHNPYQAATEEDARVNKEAEDYCSIQMEKRMFHESGQEGRSVLGMLAVQVERDPKTGATVVRSVAPVSTPAGAARDNTVFDDGRKSIHTVGGSGGQPSTEELGQILSVIDGVGMEALLDEVTVMPIEANNVEASGPLKENLSLSTHQATSNGKNILLDSSRRYDLEAELSIEDNAVSVGNEKDKKDNTSIMVVRDMVVDNVEVQRLEEGPVTLLFLGYTDATPDPGSGQEGDEGMITVERVIITEDGEEYVVGPETSASPPSTSNKEPEQEAGKESQEVFQDIPLDGARVKVQDEEGDKGLHKSSSPSVAAAEGTSQHKTCQCCSVM